MFSLSSKLRPPISLLFSLIKSMAVSHRKLLFTVSINGETTQKCKPFCDPIKNPQGLCPIPCYPVCISNCYQKVLSHIPPRPPELVSPPVDPPHHHSKISAPLIIFLFILVTLLSLFLCFTIFKRLIAWYRRRSRQRSSPQTDLEETHDEFLDEDHGLVLDHPIWYIRTIGLQPSVIGAITICKYKRGEGLVEGTECSVCLTEFQEDETLRLLPKCNHAFHIPCIDTWLRSHTNCPLCRAGIMSNIAGLPTPEQSIDNSNVLEDTQVGLLMNNAENGREIEEGTSELRFCVEEEGTSGIENGIKKNEIDKEELGNIDRFEVHEVQPVRRSVSMDFLSVNPVEINANPIHSTGNWDRRMVKAHDLNIPKGVDSNQRLIRLMGNSSSGSSLQKEPSSMKRSVSYSGKVLFSRHSKKSVPPS